MNSNYLKQLTFNSLLQLATDEGINASGKDEVYGCIFGRDSAITILKILRATSKNSLSSSEKNLLYSISKRALLTLCSLQGKKFNLESGEEPGKFIHEYRKEKFDHLLALEKPWYIYPDGLLRNYDSIDSTPLALIAIYRYWQQTKDAEFLLKALPAVELGLNWIISYGDRDKDFLVEYELPKERVHGGLRVQSWTDSHEALLTKEGHMPEYPIAPIEVQGYVWLSLKLWGDFYSQENGNYAHTENFAQKLLKRALEMKKIFNEVFLFKDEQYIFGAQALDGVKNQIRTITGNPLLLLWATYSQNSYRETILDEDLIPSFVNRAFMSDLFDGEAGIRTMSTKSLTFDSTTNSYHNGSFWPKLNGMIHEGLENWEYNAQANDLKKASLMPLEYFKSPIELYVKTNEGRYAEWVNNLTGQRSCREQAWSAAVFLDLLS